MRGTKTATILVLVGTGSKYEEKSTSGISHFLEHLFFKGTQKRPTTLALSSELDELGAEFNAFTGKEYTGYWVKTAGEQIERSMDIVSDMLLNSRFDPREIEREKGVIIEELNMYRDNPMIYIEDIFEQCLYGDTPAGWDTLGTKNTILKFSRKDFIRYVNSQYGTDHTTLCLVGNINTKKAIASARKYFSSKAFSARGDNFREKDPVQEVQSRPQSLIHYKKTDQAHLSLGVRGFGYNHKDKAIFKILATILGGSMSSRLFINLRERAGLAYYVRTNAEVYTDVGYLTTRVGVPAGKLDQAIKIILADYRKAKRFLVGAKELRRAKDLLRGRIAIQFEASDNLANWYARQAVMADTLGRGKAGYKKTNPATPEEYIKTIDRITPEQIRRIARTIFVNKGLNFSVIGPYRDGKRFEEMIRL